MGDIAVRVERLGKRYQIGLARAGMEGPLGLRHALEAGVRRAINRFRGRAKVEPNGEFWALREISFEVKRGECVGIIGRNGAGKSTLLKVLSQITEPTEGEVRLRGRVASLLEVGTGFHTELTGRENIYLNGSVLGMSRAEVKRKFDEIVAFSEVEKFLDTPVKRYSSGMFVRLAFAVAAHLEPEILIVDEVLAVGDAEFQKKCLGRMSEVAGHGRTVLFVSHNMALVNALCQSSVLLAGGRVVYSGETTAATSQYMATGVVSSQRVFSRNEHGIRLERVGLVEPDSGVEVPTPVFGRSYKLRVDLDCDQPHDSAMIAVYVDDLAGVRVGGLLSAEEGLTPKRLSGKVRFEFNMPQISLLPRTYSLSVLVTKPLDATHYLAEEDASRFDVQPAIVRGGMWPYYGKVGYVRLADGVTVDTWSQTTHPQ